MAEEKKQEKKEEKETKTEEKKEKAEEKKEEKPVSTKAAGEAKASIEEKKPKKPAPSGKFKDLIKKIEDLSVLELADLVKELEERFGVSAVPTAIAGAGIPTTGGVGTAPEKEEKSSFTIHLSDAGTQKIAVIKAVRVILPDLGLKEAKDLVDGAPKDLKKDVPKTDAEKAKADLEAAGAKVELR